MSRAGNQGPLAVRVLTAEDVPVFRMVRLEALESSPESFGAHVGDQFIDEELWIRG